jgi:hypothetical protein
MMTLKPGSLVRLASSSGMGQDPGASQQPPMLRTASAMGAVYIIIKYIHVFM